MKGVLMKESTKNVMIWTGVALVWVGGLMMSTWIGGLVGEAIGEKCLKISEKLLDS